MPNHLPIPRAARRAIDTYQSQTLKAVTIAQRMMGPADDVNLTLDAGTHSVVIAMITIIEAMIRRISVLIVPYIILTGSFPIAAPKRGNHERDAGAGSDAGSSLPTYPSFKLLEPTATSRTASLAHARAHGPTPESLNQESLPQSPAQAAIAPRMREGDRDTVDVQSDEGTESLDAFPLHIHLIRLQRALLDPIATATKLARLMDKTTNTTPLNPDTLQTLDLRVLPQHMRKLLKKLNTTAIAHIESGKAKPSYQDSS